MKARQNIAGLKSPQAAPKRVMHEAVRRKPKLWWRHPGLRNASNMVCLLRKAAGCTQNQPKRERAMLAMSDKAVRSRLPNSFGNCISRPCATDARHGATGLICPPGFQFCFGPILLCPYFSLLEWLCLFCAILFLDVCNLFCFVLFLF